MIPAPTRSSSESSTTSSSLIPDRIKIKVTTKSESRLLLVPLDVTIELLASKIVNKFGGDERKIRYLDEDNELVLMLDQEDLVYALECAGVAWNLRGGKMEVFCE
jgi:hypothetical protein